MSCRLRPAVLAQIKQALEENGYFLVADFDIKTESPPKTKDDSMQLIITNTSMPQFFLSTTIPVSRTETKDSYGAEFDFLVNYCPGEVNEKEYTRVRGMSKLISAIQAWAQRMKEDLNASPLARKMEEQSRLIEELSRQINEQAQEEKYFTKAEALEMKQRLSELESRFAEQITQSKLGKDETTSKLANLHQDIETLQSQVDVMQKRGFFRSVLTRMTNWVGDPGNRPLLEAGGHLIRGMLTSGSATDMTNLPPVS
jgi:type I site-specific restriction-modification system R (restriction) subunit